MNAIKLEQVACIADLRRGTDLDLDRLNGPLVDLYANVTVQELSIRLGNVGMEKSCKLAILHAQLGLISEGINDDLGSGGFGALGRGCRRDGNVLVVEDIILLDPFDDVQIHLP